MTFSPKIVFLSRPSVSPLFPSSLSSLYLSISLCVVYLGIEKRKESHRHKIKRPAHLRAGLVEASHYADPLAHRTLSLVRALRRQLTASALKTSAAPARLVDASTFHSLRTVSFRSRCPALFVRVLHRARLALARLSGNKKALTINNDPSCCEGRRSRENRTLGAADFCINDFVIGY